MADSPLFTMRVAVSDPDTRISIAVYERPVYFGTHTYLDIRVRSHWTAKNGTKHSRTVFKRGALWVGIPMNQSIDGKYARSAVLGCVAMKPGDTDRDYFDQYTTKQLVFAEQFGEELSMIREERYGE